MGFEGVGEEAGCVLRCSHVHGRWVMREAAGGLRTAEDAQRWNETSLYAGDFARGDSGGQDAEAEPMVSDPTNSETLVLARARALARAIGDSVSFRALEAARQALVAEPELMRRLRRYQSGERELEPLQGGVDPREQGALEAERGSLAEIPIVGAYLEAQQDLEAFLETMAQAMTEAAGVDFASACAPAGGCCS